VTLEIKDSKNNSIRLFRSDDPSYPIPPVNIPLYWIRPQQGLSAAAGAHRFLWDMHYTPLNTAPAYPIAAVFGNTAPQPTSPWVMPGNYTAILTVNGQSYTQSFTIKMDPRVKTATKDLQEQHDYSLACYSNRIKAASYLDKIIAYRKKNTNLSKELDQQLSTFAGAVSRGRGAVPKEASFGSLINGFDRLLQNLQQADVPATQQTIEAVNKLMASFSILEKNWIAFESTKLN
ncbi:MAG: hypothetical protein ABIS69_02390, partial [Sediminibacterium sp.]